MAVLQAHDVRRSNVSILICFVWVVRCYAAFRCEGELCHHVADFILLRLRFCLAAGGRRIVLRLAIACLVSRDIFPLFRIWLLVLSAWRHLLHIHLL